MSNSAIYGGTSNLFSVTMKNLGLETLHLRMPRHCENALACAKFLKNHPKVAWVNYAGLEDSPYYALAQKQFKGGREKSIQFMDSLKMICIVTHVADARSCVLYSASHTHRQLTDEQLVEAGVAPDLIRFSVGIENIEDIIADLTQALDKV